MERRQGKRTEKTRRYYDYSLLFIIIFLSCFGLIMIYSSSAYVAEMKFSDGSIHFLKRQALISAASFVVMLVISKMNYHFFAKFAVLGYGAAVLCMILVNFTPLGIERNGQKRWLGVSESLSFQPTELVKVAVILALACLIVLYVKRKKMDEWGTIFLMVFVTAVPGLLVLMNNLSSGIIILGIGFTMVFVASRKKLRFAVVVGLGVVAVIAALQLGDKLVEMGVLESYQLDRIHVWRSPESYPLEGGYQVLQGLYAIGSGGIFGKGLGNSIQKLSFVPEAQNDMIFSIICEELGLFGAACLILLFLFMIWRFMVIANNAPDLLGSMIVVGVMAHIAIQVILNIAVITNTIPNTGITLPFISYGGTSVLFLMVEMGMVLSVSNQIKIEK
ncbi:FtsW/RodA/SpoVE family cell cycle protein [Lachnotalea sp. AF33-28]|uniref:FtsW/RodA/SpoVE family cell cycle protein n=1 Tax=Lachnotalea sp. AF33-28 TaxID=2292046 RepID=UPI000E53AB98|nr:putative peptidoglycan glycosyltransferase FtsW [Lachnotalea sp. AF33-28]RHP35420.1 cell division protein FtsW [Lachnotalea sp. AF33-28]